MSAAFTWVLLIFPYRIMKYALFQKPPIRSMKSGGKEREWVSSQVKCVAVGYISLAVQITVLLLKAKSTGTLYLHFFYSRERCDLLFVS